MTLLSSIKCICYLIKCSKYLYFIKKAVCIITAVLAAVIFISFLGNSGFSIKKLKEMF